MGKWATSNVSKMVHTRWHIACGGGHSVLCKLLMAHCLKGGPQCTESVALGDRFNFTFCGTLFTRGNTFGGTSLAVGTTVYCVNSLWHLACKGYHGVQSRSPLVTGSITLFVAPCLQGCLHATEQYDYWVGRIW